MILSLIAGIGKNNELGLGNALLWDLPRDMKHFRETTSGHPVIMGRKTFESIGKPLPKRRNIVITRDNSYMKDGIEVANSLEEALRLASLDQGKNFEENQEEVEAFIIGGAEIYKQAIAKAGRLYITHVDSAFEADAFFPAIDQAFWKETKREHYDADEQNNLPMDFVVYERTIAK
ncbi:MAG: dihydrofolate reductase [Patescibacteria group bacterium]|nr:dihydrofolate reductase [Patescibacteria group bacterium]